MDAAMRAGAAYGCKNGPGWAALSDASGLVCCAIWPPSCDSASGARMTTDGNVAACVASMLKGKGGPTDFADMSAETISGTATMWVGAIGKATIGTTSLARVCPGAAAGGGRADEGSDGVCF